MFLVLLKVSTSDVFPVNRDMFLVLLKVITSGVSPVNRDMFLVLLGFFYIKTNNNINTTVSCFSRV